MMKSSLLGDIMNIHDHEAEAWSRWHKHVCTCADELGITFGEQETSYMRESFEECMQIKILYHTSEIKVKWEHRCWWADCPKHVFFGDYYCVLSDPTWYEPGLQSKVEEE